MTPFILFCLTIGYFWHTEPTFPQPENAGKEYVEKIRRGEEPPIQVMHGMGFEFAADRSDEARARFFASHEQVDGKWIPKAPAAAPVLLSVPLNDPHQLCGPDGCKPIEVNP